MSEKRDAGSGGIRVRHNRVRVDGVSRMCAAAAGGACTCSPSYEAAVRDKRLKKKIRATFASEKEAEKWLRAQLVAKDQGRLQSPSSVTLRAAAEAWLEGAEAGRIRTRSGDVYKPSVLRGYRSSLERVVLPDLGALKLSDVRRVDVQDLVDRLLGDGKDPSTIRNAIMPLRVIFRRAVQRSEVAASPCVNLELPAVRGRRDRIAALEEAQQLLAALEADDRAVWATAFYAGLRLGELRALRVEDVDRTGRLLHVRASWDQHAGPVAPKSRAGERKVPIPAVLMPHLLDRLARIAWSGDGGLLFGRTASRPFNPKTLSTRAARAWAKRFQCGCELDPEVERLDREGQRVCPEHGERLLQPIRLHEARHTYASLMIAAGVNAKALSTFMGHSSIQITLDRYGHLMPGSEDEAAALLDAYLNRPRQPAAAESRS